MTGLGVRSYFAGVLLLVDIAGYPMTAVSVDSKFPHLGQTWDTVVSVFDMIQCCVGISHDFCIVTSDLHIPVWSYCKAAWSMQPQLAKPGLSFSATTIPPPKWGFNGSR